MLPEKFADFLEAKQAAEVDVARVTFQMPRAVVGANVNFAIGDSRIAISLRTQFGRPFDVGSVVDVPFDRDILAVGGVVLAGPSAPLRPVLWADFQLGEVFGDSAVGS